jgi:arylsulfatase
MDVVGVEAPAVVHGFTQSPIQGKSMRYSFDDSQAESTRTTQFYSMLGSRGIYHQGWKAVTNHPTISGWGNFGKDVWELYHTEVDRSELNNLADEFPEKLREMINLWYSEAGANQAFPLDDRGAVEIVTTPRPQPAVARNRYVYYPNAADVPENASVNIRNRSYIIGAELDITDADARGVIFAHGSRFGGHALYVKDRRLHYVYNFVGRTEQRISSTAEIPTGKSVILSASFEKTGEQPRGVANGVLSLYFGETKVGEGSIKTQPGKFSIAGEGLCVGRDSGEPVTDDYPGTPPYAFTGGTIKRVAVDVSGDAYVDLEREAVAMMSRE